MKKVAVAMSGGVDSSVSAALLKEAGFVVFGVFMKFWHPSYSKGENRCCSSESEKRARMVAKKVGIPFYVINAEKEFEKKVFSYFIREYKAGVTPNPCVVCNYEIKFGLLLNKILKMGADYIATGHYARISNGKLLKAIDKDKDQSYFLWKLGQKQLSRVLFPIGGYKKQEVRKLAEKFKLPTAKTPESQEICFVTDSTNEFLKKYIKNKPGDITDKKGNKLGGHDGLWFYTIGQRRGIKLPGGPYYVVDKDLKKNVLIVSKNKKDLMKNELIIKNVNFISSQNFPLKVEVKIRYRHNSEKAILHKMHKTKYKIKFAKPQMAITSGQSAVIYKGNELIGGGIIL